MPKWTSRFDERLDVDPPIGEDVLRQVPAKRGVLLLATGDDEPICLLTAADMRGRLRRRLTEPEPDERKKTADLRGITRTILWSLASSHFEADRRFLRIARAIWPKRHTGMLAWKPAWFVHVDPAGEYPHFARTRDVFAEDGRYVGPFPSGKSADRFIEAVQDAFDLCRHVRHLHQAPHGQRCAYAQIGKCLSPCDGSISMDEYRMVVAAAADFAAGNRDPRIAQLQSQMKHAAGELAFERAAAIKSRLERIGELDGEEFAEAGPAERMRFVIVQRGGSTRRAKVFLDDLGRIVEASPLDYPLDGRQLRRTIERMRRCVGRTEPWRPERRWEMGLTAHYLFAGAARRGVMLRWRDDLDAGELTEAIEAGRDQLGLNAPAQRESQREEPAPPSDKTGPAEPGEGASGDGS